MQALEVKASEPEILPGPPGSSSCTKKAVGPPVIHLPVDLNCCRGEQFRSVRPDRICDISPYTENQF